jgi:hypothetical protein
MAGETGVSKTDIVEVASTDEPPRGDAGDNLREFVSSYIGLFALIGIVVAVIGFVLSLVTLADWASVMLFVGLGIFCVAGLAARHDNARRLGAARMPPHRGLLDLEL